MILDLKKLFITENMCLPIEYSLDLSHEEFSGVFPLKQPVNVCGEVKNKAGLVLLRLEIGYQFTAPCDRCGNVCTNSNNICFERSLATSIEGEESDSILTVPEMKLNLDELCYTEVVLSIPHKHLCTENCKGLCPVCGQNLNEGECSCSQNQ